MNKELFKHNFKKQTLSLVFYSLSLFLFQLLMISLYPGMGESMFEMMENIPEIMQNMFGGEIISLASLNNFVSIGYNHPIPVFILIIYPLNIAVSAIAAEISRGTGELLFTKPIRRYKILVTNFLVIICGGIILAAFSILGTPVGMLFIDIEGTIDFIYLFRLFINSFALIVAVAGITFLVSVIFKNIKNSGKKAGIVIALMYVLDFLVDIWDSIQPLRFTSIFNYYNPEKILQGETTWLTDSIILFLAGLLLALLTIYFLEKRDL